MFYLKIILYIFLLMFSGTLFCRDYVKEFNLFENSDLMQNKKSINLIDFDELRPKIGIAFSGGGARGFAQIGALKALVEEGIPIDYVVGTSIGSVVAGLYAVGYTPEQMDSIIKSTNWQETITFNDDQSRSDLFLDQKLIQDRSVLTLRFQNFEFVVPEAISLGTRFTAFLQKLIWNGLYHDDGDFNNLKVPFRAVATDLVSGKTVVLNSGNLITAIRASSSFPLRYTPIRVDSMVLVDGGLMSNIPTKYLSEFKPDITIAINTISPLLAPEELNKPWNIADQVVSLLMKQFSDKDSGTADFTISPDLGYHGYTEFKNLDSLVNMAYLETKKIIPEIKEKMNTIRDSLAKERFKGFLGNYYNLEFSGFDVSDLSIIDTFSFKNSSFENRVEKMLLMDSAKKYLGISLNNYKIDNQSNILIKAIRHPVISLIKIDSETKNFSYDSLSNFVHNSFSGKLLSNETLSDMVVYILKTMRNKGFSFAEIVNIKYNNKSGELSIYMHEGIINKIKILGVGDNDYLIRRELKFSNGSSLNSNTVLESWESVVSIDFISDAEIILKKDRTNGLTDVTINTKSIGDQAILIGARVDNERFTRIGLDLVQENAFNLGTRASIRFMGGVRDRFIGMKAENTRLLNTFFTNSYGIYYSSNDKYHYSKLPITNRNRFEYSSDYNYTEERYGAKFTLGMQMEKKGTLYSELRYENQRFWNSGMSPDDFRKLFSIKISSVFDNENKSEFATQGSLLDMSLESTLLKDDDAVSFSKVMFSYRVNYEFGSLVVKPRLNFGFADGTTPLTEFFSLGGQELFFGMREDELRGRQVSNVSLETRLKSPYPLFFDTYISVRYDLGSAWENFETIKFSGLRHGIGSTLSFDTPLGPAKFSIGRSFSFLKNPNAVAWGNVMGYFSIGMRL